MKLTRHMSLRKAAVGLGLGLAVGSAQAVTVGGVTWDPNDFFDFTAGDSMIESIGSNVGDTIGGYARITAVNGAADSSYCASGCELTYTFSGYTITNIDAGTGAFTFSGGVINIYADSTPNYSQALASTAGDGVLWLSLAGAAHIDGGTGQSGTLHSDPTPTIGGVEGDGRGYLNVVGGLAAAYFDTDTFDIITAGGPATADFLFTSSFQLLPNGSFTSDDGVEYGLFGTNDIQGDSVGIPAPGTLALTGLALFGAGFIRRRKA